MARIMAASGGDRLHAHARGSEGERVHRERTERVALDECLARLPPAAAARPARYSDRAGSGRAWVTASGKSGWASISHESQPGRPRSAGRTPRWAEADRPVVPGVGLAPVEPSQVVDRVAAGDDQHPLLAQWRQPGTQVEVVGQRLASRPRRAARPGCRRPGKAWTSTDQVPWSIPQLSSSSPTQTGSAAFTHLGRQLGRTRGRVLHREQLGWEAEEVVDGARRRHRGDGGRVDEPVRGHATGCARGTASHLTRSPKLRQASV